MSRGPSAYEILIKELLLPSDILAVVESPFKDRGYPLQQEVTYDPEDIPITYFVSICNNQKVVLLHLAGTVVEDRSNFRDVGLFAATFFATRSIGLFFFAPIKDLNSDYNLLLATRWKDDYPNLKEVRFFNRGEIDTLAAKPPQSRNRLLSRLFSLDLLMPPGNGAPASKNGAPPEVTTPVTASSAVTAPPATQLLDAAEIQDRVIELLYGHYKTTNGDPRDFFVSLRDDLKWPPGWEWEPEKLPKDSAQRLVIYLIGQKSYPPGSNIVGFTPLGKMLHCLISMVGGEQIIEIYQMITKYKLIENEEILLKLKEDYCRE